MYCHLFYGSQCIFKASATVDTVLLMNRVTWVSTFKTQKPMQQKLHVLLTSWLQMASFLCPVNYSGSILFRFVIALTLLTFRQSNMDTVCTKAIQACEFMTDRQTARVVQFRSYQRYTAAPDALSDSSHYKTKQQHKPVVFVVVVTAVTPPRLRNMSSPSQPLLHSESISITEGVSSKVEIPK